MGSITLVITGLLYFANIIRPFVIAILVWFIINELKNTLGKITLKGRTLPNWIRSVLAFLIIIVIGYFAAVILTNNLEGIAASMPEYIANLNKYFDEIRKLFKDPKYAEYLQKWINGIDFAGSIATLVNSFSGFVANFAIVLVYAIFFLLEESNRKLKFKAMYVGKAHAYQRFMNNVNKISGAIRSYLWQKTLISIITALLSYVILLIMGIEYAILWSFLIFILNFIPYIGPLVSSLLPSVFALLVSGSLMKFVYVFAAMEGVQIVLGNFVEPKMMGKGTNLGPVPVILSLALWGMLWGVTGMILAVPITALLVIALSQFPSTRNLAILLSEKGEILDIAE